MITGKSILITHCILLSIPYLAVIINNIFFARCRYELAVLKITLFALVFPLFMLVLIPVLKEFDKESIFWLFCVGTVLFNLGIGCAFARDKETGEEVQIMELIDEYNRKRGKGGKE